MTTPIPEATAIQSVVHTADNSRSASISECGRYRYALERHTGIAGPNLTWLMLNPSTADAFTDDPTIRKIVGFTRRAGCGVAMVVNLFAWRATDPRDVINNFADAEGEHNCAAIMQAAAISDAVVCAWGPKPWAKKQAERVLQWLDEHPNGPRKLLCIRRAKDGSPMHPLMQPYALGLNEFQQ